MERFDVIDEVPFDGDIDSMLLPDGMDDMEAESCITKIGNWERYREFWLDFYAKKIDEVKSKCDKNIELQKRKLKYYFNTVPHRSTKTMEAYDLPSGRLSVDFSKPSMVPDKDAILERFKSANDNEFIKVKVSEELDWNSYKSRLFISESGEIFDKETGEVVKDVSVKMSEPKFTVKINKKESEEE